MLARTLPFSVRCNQASTGVQQDLAALCVQHAEGHGPLMHGFCSSGLLGRVYWHGLSKTTLGVAPASRTVNVQ